MSFLIYRKSLEHTMPQTMYIHVDRCLGNLADREENECGIIHAFHSSTPHLINFRTMNLVN